MGIQGLLPFLKKVHTPVNISQFCGQTVAIDAYCWLHKGAFSCAEKLALGEHTDQYVYFCMKFVEYMLRNGLKPILVFDGCHLPSKKGVEKARRERRDIFKKKAAVFLREGKRAEARECLQRCIDVTPQMALNLMNACRERGVDCIVAPYEADAQLAYLNRVGIAHIIVTEDSDLLLFGCEKVIFKMDFNGNGFLVEKSRLNEALEIQNGFYTFAKFRYTCILSGCDYLPSLHGVGLGKAAKVFRTARQADIRQLLKKLPAYIKLKNDVPSEYVEGFIKADNTFLYQLAFDPIKGKIVPLNPYPPELDASDLDYAGPFIPDDHAYQIALGNIDINNGCRIADFDPDTFKPSKCSKKQSENLHMLSIWSKSYRPMPRIGLKEIQLTERPVLKGKEMTVETRIVKRPRHTIDCKDVKSDNELTDLYEEPAPDAKRLKLQEPEENCSTLEEIKREEDLETSPVTSPLKDSHTQIPLSAADIGEVAMKTDEKKNKENILVVPKRNKFAVSSLAKKRFNLNAPKQDITVRSRFFAKSEDLHLKSENIKKETCMMLEECSPLNQQDSDVDGKMSSDTTGHRTSTTHTESRENCERAEIGTGKCFNVLTSLNRCSSMPLLATMSDVAGHPTQDGNRAEIKNCKKSSESAFSWNKFKYVETCENSSKNKSLINTCFKPVVATQQKSTFFSEVKCDSPRESNLSCELDKSSQIQNNIIDSNFISPSESLNNIETKNSDRLLPLKRIPHRCLGRNQENVSKFFSSVSRSDSLLNSKSLNSSTLAECTTVSLKPTDDCNRLHRSVPGSINSSGDPASEYETFSQRSNLESIDSDCQSSQEVIDLTDTDHSTNSTLGWNDEKVSLRKSLSQSNCKKKQCRVSGLSRSSNKKKEKTIAMESQKSIKDMFSNFALKRQIEKLPASNNT